MDLKRNISAIPIHYIKSGQPCKHKGCLSHSSHPCEVCGRINGIGDVNIDWFEYERKLKKSLTK